MGSWEEPADTHLMYEGDPSGWCLSTWASTSPSGPRTPTGGSDPSKTSQFQAFFLRSCALGTPKGLLRRKWPPRIVQETRSPGRPGSWAPEIDENTAKKATAVASRRATSRLRAGRRGSGRVPECVEPPRHRALTDDFLYPPGSSFECRRSYFLSSAIRV